MNNQNEEIINIGIIGLGLMGQGIASCFIRYGFNVIAYSRTAAREQETFHHISRSYKKLIDRDIITESETDGWRERFKYVKSLEDMKECQFIIETVGESLELKKQIYKTIESIVEKDVVIATNTSGILISLLQKELINKERL